MDGDDGQRIGLYYYPIMIINHTYIATTVLYDTCTYILAAAVISHSWDRKFINSILLAVIYFTKLQNLINRPVMN